MKRFVLAILLVTAVASLVFAMLNRPGAEASPDVTITVNSAADSDNRDNVLTLREAMLLAKGHLTVDALYHGECDQVSGAIWLPYPILDCSSLEPPGAASADTVVFDTTVFPPGNPKTISLSAALPGLTKCDDTVDGSSAGVIVDGSTTSYDCFDIASDNNTIRGMEIYGCRNGVVISGHGNIIGGLDSGEGNVISGHVEVGVRIAGSAASNNAVVGNYIGTNAAGDAAVPNGVGVEIASGAQTNIIGSPPPGRGNVISGNDQVGVRIAGSATTINGVVNNYIGTDASGTAALPNNVGGVEIGDGAWMNVIGYDLPGSGNIIAFNGDYGVLVKDNSIRIPILGNSIHSNGGKGISLIGNGNLGRQPPIIEGVGPVFGTACADCDVDIYSDDEDEGRVYEGSTTADGDGKWTFSGSPQGPNVTATATDGDGNTSEFSAPVAVPEATPTPTPTPTATPTPTPSPTPTPTPTATGTPTPTRTVTIPARSWANFAWTGDSSPQEVANCFGDGNIAVMYRLDAASQVFEGWFRGAEALSTMGDVARFDALLALNAGDQPATCTMPDPAPVSPRTLTIPARGWANFAWTTDSSPQEVANCYNDHSIAVMYRLDAASQVFEGWFRGAEALSTIGGVAEFDALLAFNASAEVATCTMAGG